MVSSGYALSILFLGSFLLLELHTALFLKIFTVCRLGSAPIIALLADTQFEKFVTVQKYLLQGLKIIIYMGTESMQRTEVTNRSQSDFSVFLFCSIAVGYNCTCVLFKEKVTTHWIDHEFLRFL